MGPVTHKIEINRQNSALACDGNGPRGYHPPVIFLPELCFLLRRNESYKKGYVLRNTLVMYNQTALAFSSLGRMYRRIRYRDLYVDEKNCIIKLWYQNMRYKR
ncbi:hypothetical protein EVAR_38230_1 [Eumeta japonica]|uniref:Uncharacterized protein n=1 Tax=Eumeta variegata TaxID=151549 RepID=A0A4C1XFN2_EUMVA|nr:hypothetical protein EVAR_38230_1 [Eumeta japonica]